MTKSAAAAWKTARNARRLVIKIGSNLLTAGGQNLRREWIRARCGEIAGLMASGRQVVLVSSGAVAAGTPRLKLNRPLRSLPEKQAAAAAGQGVLMRCYEEALASHDLHAAQILITRDDVTHRRRYLNARDTLETLLSLGLVPVVNENDSVMVEELKFGDNDTLAALVAGLVGADLLLLLTDVPALYDANPRKNPDAKAIHLVEQVTAEVEEMAGGTGSLVGSGGMVTKLLAAKKAARFGCPTILASGEIEAPLTRILDPDSPPAGTLFLAEAGDPISHRKRWIANGLTAQGTLDLDQGAVTALLKGKSLLARGVVAVEGNFDRGAAVYCRTPDGEHLGKGLVNYTADHLRQIAGCHSDQFEAILGYMGDPEILHRDNLVILNLHR
ncbi:MAG: glutamate 5-kinase [Magnetococcales bacterium]|nr:glutamate 5-kinase [Magnetococcales bacterium]